MKVVKPDVDHLSDEVLLHELAAQGVSEIYRHPAAAKPAGVVGGNRRDRNEDGEPFRYSGLVVLTVRETLPDATASVPTLMAFWPQGRPLSGPGLWHRTRLWPLLGATPPSGTQV
ncbi:hypothetical protein quinque_005363 [Culex quinquefasciatus]